MRSQLKMTALHTLQFFRKIPTQNTRNFECDYEAIPHVSDDELVKTFSSSIWVNTVNQS